MGQRIDLFPVLSDLINTFDIVITDRNVGQNY